MNEFKSYSFEVDLYRNGNPRDVHFYFGENFIASQSKKIFIVQDGQYALDKNDVNKGVSWDLHKKLSDLGVEDYLVLAISSKEEPKDRIKEYSFAEINYKFFPEMNVDFTPGGKLYIDSIIDSVIPEMEKRFDFNYLDSEIIMVGAGYGSLPVYLAAHEYKDIFSGYILLSPPLFTQLGVSFITQEQTWGQNVYIDIEADLEGKKIAGIEMTKTTYSEKFNEFFETLKYGGVNVYKKVYKESDYDFKSWTPRVAKGIEWYIENKIER